MARQKHLEQHQQALKEVNVLFFFKCSHIRDDQSTHLEILLFKSYLHVITDVHVVMLCISGQMEEFANFDFNIWRKRYIQWISHLKSRILDVFRSIDRDQDGRITQKEFVDYVLASSKIQLILSCYKK